MADLFFNKLNDPLSIGRGSPAPVAQKFGEDDTGTMKAQIGVGQQRLEKSYAEQERLIGETGNITSKLYEQTANLVRYKNEQELFKAKQQEEAAKADSENITKMLDEIRSGPLYKQKQETNKQIAEYSAFVPTEVTAPMLGVLFATIGATGMLLGGNSKNTAKAALSAMNGMAEGFAKGREQYDKERKQAFDSNVKLLQTKLSAINDGLEDARKEAILNKQAADLKVRETLASNDAQFLQENTNRRGLESTIELVKGQLASLNKSLELQKTKTNQIEGQLQRQSDNLMYKNLQISATQASQQMQRDFLRGMQEDRQAAQIEAEERRARERKEDIKLTASLRPGPAPTIYIQDGQPVALNARSLPTANVSPGAPPISSLGASAAAAKEAAKTAGVSGVVKDAIGKDVPGKEAEILVNTSIAIQTARELQAEIRNNPDFVGRQGQLGNFLSRYLESAVSGKPAPPDDPNLNQASLRWAKKYATYLVEYERALAGGAKGFTVFFQRRFNDLLSQNQFNAEGMSGLLDDQIREAARLAAGKTVYATSENLRKIAERNNEIAMGFGAQPTTPAKTTSGATVSNW